MTNTSVTERASIEYVTIEQTGGYLIPIISTVDAPGRKAWLWRKLGRCLWGVSFWFDGWANECSRRGVTERDNSDIIEALRVRH